MSFDPTRLPGLLLWIESDGSEDLSLKFKKEGVQVYCWSDPNFPDRGIQLILDRPLSPEQDAELQAWLVSLYNPSMDDLPRS